MHASYVVFIISSKQSRKCLCQEINTNKAIKIDANLLFCFCFRRAVLVLEPENPGGEAVDITPKEFGVRTLAQEYGGGAFTVAGDVVFFANYKDQRLYKQSITSLGEEATSVYMSSCFIIDTNDSFFVPL